MRRAMHGRRTRRQASLGRRLCGLGRLRLGFRASAKDWIGIRRICQEASQHEIYSLAHSAFRVRFRGGLPGKQVRL